MGDLVSTDLAPCPPAWSLSGSLAKVHRQRGRAGPALGTACLVLACCCSMCLQCQPIACAPPLPWLVWSWLGIKAEAWEGRTLKLQPLLVPENGPWRTRSLPGASSPCFSQEELPQVRGWTLSQLLPTPTIWASVWGLVLP